jgi:diaminohydroxyphosphoribosylaminopyrimidine deaminase/5-amino-6-(5-phosphoribosylamino)uracil reductase
MQAERYMMRCLELAGKGAGHVAPNPMVGAVIVINDTIIGEGYHKAYGGPHAEVNAINSVKEGSLLKDATLHVNLEPCSHYGKTPPCTVLIIEKGIRHVVVGASDPNALVNGQGVDLLRKAGCRVETNILHEECLKLNRFYYTFHTQKRPYIILKWAQTTDGFISPAGEGERPIYWITGEPERMLVHKWRSEIQGIMAGTGTLLADNPQLTVRSWPGKSPLRIIADRRARLPQMLHVFNDDADTILFTTQPGTDREHLRHVGLSSQQAPLTEILGHLFDAGIQSLLVEGGRMLLESFIAAGLWDEARVFTGTLTLAAGTKAPFLPLSPRETLSLANSRLDIYYNTILM